jgi:hypothetical protein
MADMRRTLWVLLPLALLAGCARVDAQAGAGALALDSAPIDSALVTPQFGWLLTAGQVLLTRDGGASFQAAPVQLPAGQARAAYFRDALHGWVAAADGTSVSVARTSDGGASWQVGSVTGSEPIGAVAVGFGDPANGALVAKVQTSGAFSKAHFFDTTDGGASWRETGAPVAGTVGVDPGGRIWLAGGVLGNELYTSTDQGKNWAKPAIQLGQAGPVDAVTPPQNGVLSVTSGSRVAVLTSADGGGSWRESASVPLADTTGAAAPVAVRDASVLVAEPTGGRLHRIDTKGARSDPNGSGLPAGVSHLSFASTANGWAMSAAGNCAKGKEDCSITYTVAATADGGNAWHAVATFVEAYQ